MNPQAPARWGHMTVTKTPSVSIRTRLGTSAYATQITMATGKAETAQVSVVILLRIKWMT